MKDSSLLCWLRQICCLNKQPDTSDKVFFQCSRSLYGIKSMTLHAACTNRCTCVHRSLWWSVSELPAMAELCSRQFWLFKGMCLQPYSLCTSQTEPWAFWAAWKIKVSCFTMLAGAPVSWVTLCHKPRPCPQNPYPVLKNCSPRTSETGCRR